MKGLLLWYGHPFIFGGTEKYSIMLGNYLSKKYEITYICGSIAPKDIVKRIKKLKNIRINFKILQNSSLNQLSYHIRNNILFPLLFIRERNIKFIYLVSPALFFSLITSIPLVSFKKIKLIIGNHCFFPTAKFYLKKKTATFLSITILGLLVKLRIFNKNKIKVHVLNSLQLKIYKSLGFENIYLIPNYIETEKIKNIVNSDEFSVSYIGRITKDQKGIDILTEVIGKVLEKNKNLKFYIAGKGEKEWEDKLKDLEYKYPNNVKYLGFISEDEKYDLLSKNSIFISPSRWEGMSLSVLEALSEGNICLLSNIPEFCDILKFDQKFGFICKDTREYVNKILELYNLWKTNRKAFLEWRRYIQNKALEIFNIEKIAKDFEEKFILSV